MCNTHSHAHRVTQTQMWPLNTPKHTVTHIGLHYIVNTHACVHAGKLRHETAESQNEVGPSTAWGGSEVKH